MIDHLSPLSEAETRAYRAALAVAFPLSHRGAVGHLSDPIRRPEDAAACRLFHEFMLNPPTDAEVEARVLAEKLRVEAELGSLRENYDDEQHYQLTGSRRKGKAQSSSDQKAATASILASLDLSNLGL